MNRQCDDQLRSAIAALAGVRLTTLISTLAGQQQAPIDSDMKAFWAALSAVAEDVAEASPPVRPPVDPTR